MADNSIKLFIMFFILRLFFFPNYLNEAAVGVFIAEGYVSNELIRRARGTQSLFPALMNSEASVLTR